MLILLFIVTNSRTIAFFAHESAKISNFQYESIEGNLYKGLTVKSLSFNHNKLFDKAVLHWNPLTLLNKRVTLTQLEIEGANIDNISKVVTHFSHESNNSSSKLDYDIAIDNLHLGVKPYRFEGLKISAFDLKSHGINLKKDFKFNVKSLKLKCNSNMVNVTLNGKIDKRKLLLDRVKLKDISSKVITKFVQRLLKKSHQKLSQSNFKKVKKAPFMPFDKIKIKYLFGTLKPVNYGSFDIKGTKLIARKVTVDPHRSYLYSAKKLSLTGQTNFGSIDYTGAIKASTIEAKGVVLLDNELFAKYRLPLNFNGLKKLPNKLKLNHKGVWIEVDKAVEKLLSNGERFNLDIKQSHHEIAYLYGKNLVIKSKLKGESNYAKAMEAEGETEVNFKEGKTSYRGSVNASQFTSLLPPFTEYLFEGLRADYNGVNQELNVDIFSKLLEGDFHTKGYKEATLNLKSRGRDIRLGTLLKGVDERFSNEYFAFRNRNYFDFSNMSNSTVQLDIDSNLVNMVAKMGLRDPFNIKLSSLAIPMASPLREIDSSIEYESVKDLTANVTIENSLYDITLKDKMRDTLLRLSIDATTKNILNGNLHLGQENLTFSSHNGNYNLSTTITDVQQFLKHLNAYYAFKVPNIQGALKVKVESEEAKSYVTVESENLKYLNASGMNISIFNLYDLNARFNFDKEGNIEVENYRVAIDENPYLSKFYSNKSSHLTVNKSEIFLKNFWINDEVLVNGSYDLTNKYGDLKVKTDNYTFSYEDIKIKFDADLNLKVKEDKVDISGDLVVLDGDVKYDMSSSNMAEDSDIIIVQEMLQEKSAFFKNFKLYLKVKSKNPIHFTGESVNVEFYNDLTVLKSYEQEIMLTGMSTITKGEYQYEEKRFRLDESHLYFAGDMTKPLLDIKVKYQKDSYTIDIFISGTKDEPIINFNSEPYLTQQEILSLILFDSRGTSSGDGAEAYTLLGGVFAKGLMNSLGLDIDHFLLGTDENNQLSLEIGGKISNNISVIYLNKDGQSGAKVRVEHSNNFETDIIIQPPNTSSIEFLYKKVH